MIKSWDTFSVDFTHSLDVQENTYTSTLDHFFWSVGISSSITSADVLHLTDNTSDHCPIYCSVNINTLHPKSRIPMTSQSKPCWKMATEEQREKYKVTLENDLKKLILPIVEDCNDVHCHEECHIYEIDEFMVNMLETINSAATSCYATLCNNCHTL